MKPFLAENCPQLPSPPGKFRRPLFDEGIEPFLAILGGRDKGKALGAGRPSLRELKPLEPVQLFLDSAL